MHLLFLIVLLNHPGPVFLNQIQPQVSRYPKKQGDIDGVVAGFVVLVVHSILQVGVVVWPLHRLKNAHRTNSSLYVPCPVNVATTGLFEVDYLYLELLCVKVFLVGHFNMVYLRVDPSGPFHDLVGNVLFAHLADAN